MMTHLSQETGSHDSQLGKLGSNVRYIRKKRQQGYTFYFLLNLTCKTFESFMFPLMNYFV